MQVTYCKGTPAEEQAIVDFADLVFSKSDCPHDFRSQLPNLYGRGKNTQEYHYLVKEDGVIRGMVCVLPMEYKAGKELLKINGVGSVSVHPDCKGKGYMKALMNWAIEDMEKEGFAFSVLGGQRQRYEYFGYAPAGPVLRYLVTKHNVRHRYRDVDCSGVSFEKLDELEKQGKQETAPAPWLEKAWALQQKAEAGALRKKEEFGELLRSWHAVPYGIFFQGEWIGYLCIAEGDNVMEIFLSPEEEKNLPAVLKAFFQKTGAEFLRFAFPLWERRLTPELGRLGTLTIGNSCNFRIMDFAKTAGAFLKLKNQSVEGSLREGRLILSISGRGSFLFKVEKGRASVEKLPKLAAESGGKPDLELSELEAIRFLFSPEGWRELPEAQASRLTPAVKSWLPLPLFMWEQDNC